LSKRKVIPGAEANFDSKIDDVVGNLPRELKKGKPITGFQKVSQEFDRLRAEARDEGYLTGHRAGFEDGLNAGRREGIIEGRMLALQEGRQQIQLFMQDLEKVGDSFHNAVQDWFLKMEEELSGLAIEIARKVVATELTTNSEVALAIARECITEINHAHSARVLVNLAGFAQLQGREAELMAFAKTLKSLEIVADPSLPDGVIVESEGGRIDGTIDTKVKNLTEAWEKAA
jgi:flagellar assembly protein FliH